MGNNYKVCSGRIVGRSHIKDAIPCQDNVVAKTENGVTIAVLSDGCGSSILSHIGSKITVDSVSDLLVNKFDKLFELDENNTSLTILKVIVGSQINYIKNNREKLNEEALEAQRYEREEKRKTKEEIEAIDDSTFANYLRGTLCFIAVKDNRTMYGQIGDGRVGTIVDNKFDISLQEEKTGSINTTTYPIDALARYLSNSNIEECRTLRVIKTTDVKIQAAIVMSDGCDPLIENVDKDTFFRKRFHSFALNMIYEVMFNDDEKAEALLQERLVKIQQAQGNFDDCSVGIIVQELPEDAKDIERVIKVKPHPVEESEDSNDLNKEPMNEEPNPKDDSDVESNEDDSEEEEVLDEKEQFASDTYGDMFLDVIKFASENVYDVLDSLGVRCDQDDSLSIKDLVDAYHIIIESISKQGKYVYKKEDMNQITFEIIKECDTIFDWNKNSVTKKVNFSI